MKNYYCVRFHKSMEQNQFTECHKCGFGSADEITCMTGIEIDKIEKKNNVFLTADQGHRLVSKRYKIELRKKKLERVLYES